MYAYIYIRILYTYYIYVCVYKFIYMYLCYIFGEFACRIIYSILCMHYILKNVRHWWLSMHIQTPRVYVCIFWCLPQSKHPKRQIFKILNFNAGKTKVVGHTVLILVVYPTVPSDRRYFVSV